MEGFLVARHIRHFSNTAKMRAMQSVAAREAAGETASPLQRLQKHHDEAYDQSISEERPEALHACPYLPLEDDDQWEEEALEYLGLRPRHPVSEYFCPTQKRQRT